MNGELYPGEFEAMEHNGRMDACMSREAIESMNRWNDYVNGKDVEPMTNAEPCSDVISRKVMTLGYAISLLRESGWLNKYGEECIQEAILNRHLMTPEEAKDEFNFEQGKLEGRLEVLASIKDLCNSLESEEQSGAKMVEPQESEG